MFARRLPLPVSLALLAVLALQAAPAVASEALLERAALTQPEAVAMSFAATPRFDPATFIATGAPLSLLTHLQKGAAPAKATTGFTEAQRRAIRDFYAKAPAADGAAERPVKLAKGAPIPVGVEKRSLPEDLDNMLRPPPSGQSRVLVDTDVILLDRNGRVVDLITGAARG